MHTRIIKVILLAVFFSGCLILITQNDRQSGIKLVSSEERVGLPARIRIKSINLDAAVEAVGLASDGSMGLPAFTGDAAWYKLGPRPGEKGTAVINGHVNREDGGRAVFTDLHKLKPGDEILVLDDRGVTASFAVRESRSYNQNADASDVFGSNDGRPHLNLITCEGFWNEASRSYSKRLVVFADRTTSIVN